MGGTSKTTQTQSSSLAPYEPASGALQGILGKIGTIANNTGTTTTPGQTGILDQTQADVGKLNPGILNGATSLLNGGGAQANDSAIRSNLADYKAGMAPYTDAGYSTVNSPEVRAALDQIRTDATTGINSSWAAAGRDGSPGNFQALGRGIAAAEAPLILDQANKDIATRTGALGSVYNNANTSYGLLNGTQGAANNNIAAGAGVGSAALTNDNTALTAELARTGIPISQLQTLLGTVSPIAAQFGTQNGTSSGTNTMSGAQQFATIAGGIGSLFPKVNFNFGAAG